jgi:hypothetical protein
MATSGNFLTSVSGQGGGNYFGRLIFEWWQTSSGISGSVGYHNVSYHLKTYGGSSSYWQELYNASMNVDGSGYSRGAYQAYGGGQIVLGDYSKTMYTNSSGDRSFGASAQGGIYYNTINTSGSGSWSLDHINLWGGVNSISIASPFTDESSNPSVNWFHYTGTAHLWFRLDQINNADSTYHIVAPGNPYTWSGWQTWLRTSMYNKNSSVLYIYYGDDIDNNGSVDNWQGPWTYTVTIKNDTGQANPTFTNFTYLDTNSSTVAVTGNDQVLIQGKSTLEATVSTANKATANKNANMSNYTFTIGGYSQVSNWSSGSDVVQSIGTVSDVTGTQNLSVRAQDSRTNSTTVTKSVNILPYSSPTFIPTLAVKYTNNYDNTSGLTVQASGTNIANISPLTLSGTDKNSVNTTSGVQYDMSKSNNTSYTGTWVNVPISQTSGTGAINSTSLSTLATSILTKMNGIGADNTVPWYIKFKITDSLETQYYETYIDIGRSIFRIGYDSKVYYNEVPLYSPFVISQASTSSITPNIDLVQQYDLTALAASLTINAPTGTPTTGQRLMFRFKDNGSAQNITWNSIFRNVGATMPTVTVAGKTMYVGSVYNTNATKWDVVAVSIEE